MIQFRRLIQPNLNYRFRSISILYFLFFYILSLHGQVRIKMKQENGVFTMPCKVNSLQLRFIFDTGASNVSISLSEAIFMLKNGYLKENDLIGSSYSQIANGSIIKNTKVIIRELEIGGLKLHNIEANIIHNLNAPLLLGQSAILKLGAIKIENNELIIINKDVPNSTKACENSHMLVNKARTYYYDDLYYLSAKTFQNAYDNCRNSLNCLDIYMLGESYYNMDKHLLAIRYLEESSKCLKDKELLFFCHLYLSLSYRTLRKFDDAIINIQKAITYSTNDEDFSSAYNFIAWIYDDKSEYEKAIKYYKKAIVYYLSYLHISNNDVIKGKVKDGILGEIYWNISLSFNRIDKTEEFHNYLFKSALCGYKKAIDFCNKYDINYKVLN